MSVPTTTTVKNLSIHRLTPDWFPGGQLDQFIRKLPFERVHQPGETVDWNRTSGVFPTVGIYGPGDAFTVTSMATELQTADFVRIGQICEVDYFQRAAASNPMDQLEVQVKAKAIGVLRTLGGEVLEGTGGATRMKGLKAFITSGQTIGAGNMPSVGAAPTLEDLHRLVYLVSASEGGVGAGPSCLVAAPKAVRFIIRLLEAAGLTPQFIWDPDLDAPVLLFNGLPVYLGQNSTAESKGGVTSTSIWALRLGGRTGIRLLHSTGTSEEYGIDVENVPLQGTVAKFGKFVGGHYALVVPEAESIARLDGCDLQSLIGS